MPVLVAMAVQLRMHVAVAVLVVGLPIRVPPFRYQFPAAGELCSEPNSWRRRERTAAPRPPPPGTCNPGVVRHHRAVGWRSTPGKGYLERGVEISRAWRTICQGMVYFSRCFSQPFRRLDPEALARCFSRFSRRSRRRRDGGGRNPDEPVRSGLAGITRGRSDGRARRPQRQQPAPGSTLHAAIGRGGRPRRRSTLRRPRS